MYCQEWGLTINEDVINRVKKDLRTKALNSIVVVTTKGNSFDGNESARNSMLAAIQASDTTKTTTTLWKLSDNSIVEVTLDEVKEALAMSIQKVGTIITS